MTIPYVPAYGFPCRFDTDCFKCAVRIRKGDLVFRSNNIVADYEDGVRVRHSERIVGPAFQHAYHTPILPLMSIQEADRG